MPNHHSEPSSHGHRGKMGGGSSRDVALLISLDDSDLKKIIIDGEVNFLIEKASELGKRFTEGVSSSQIRHILDKLQRMTKFDLNQLQLLRPLLAYTAGRHGDKVKELARIMEEAIKKVKEEKHFENLRNFFEAIVAYHRYYGGK